MGKDINLSETPKIYIETLTLSSILGLIKSLKSKDLNIEETMATLFMPKAMEYFKNIKVSKKIFNLIWSGTELEDLESLLPDSLNGELNRMETETLKLLKKRINKKYKVKNNTSFFKEILFNKKVVEKLSKSRFEVLILSALLGLIKSFRDKSLNIECNLFIPYYFNYLENKNIDERVMDIMEKVVNLKKELEVELYDIENNVLSLLLLLLNEIGIPRRVYYDEDGVAHSELPDNK